MCRTSSFSPPSQLVMIQTSASSAEPAFGRRLVFFGAAEDVNEPTLLQLFSRHGDVKGLFLVRSALGLPSGCGYVTMSTAEQAKAAAGALNGTTDCAEAGGKLGLIIVQPAADEVQQIKSTSADGSCISTTASGKDSRTVFFTKIPPTVTAHQLIQLFTACGEVLHVELFTPWPGAKISKGCGLVEFATVDAASAAVHSLHQAFTWPHSHSPLVVEWVDSKRQQANRANKLSKAAAAAAAAANEHPMRWAHAMPMDKDTTAMAAAMFGTGSTLNGTVPITQYNSRSAPLPRLQPSWPQAAVTWGQQAALRQLQQQQVATDAIATAGVYYPRQLQHSSSAGSSVYQSSYDTSGPLAGHIGSSISNASSLMTLSPQDASSSSLVTCPTSSAVTAGMNITSLYAQAGIQSPSCTEPALAVAAAAAMGVSRADSIWQQLQQQNIMLLQPLSNAVEDKSSSQAVLLSNASAAPGYVQDQQPATAVAAQLGNATALYAGAGSLAPAGPGVMLVQQTPQQLQSGYASLINASSMPLQHQPQQQWWVQQAQQQLPAVQQLQKDESCVIIVPLTLRQLQVMSSILPEVPRMTGAQACLTASNVDGSVQLMLSGRMSDVQSGHSVVSMLLAKLGVDEPLMPAMAQRTG